MKMGNQGGKKSDGNERFVRDIVRMEMVYIGTGCMRWKGQL